jgi:hypothetical protein
MGHRNKILVPIAFGRTSKMHAVQLKVRTQQTGRGSTSPARDVILDPTGFTETGIV